MPSAKTVWCVQDRFDLGWCAIATGKDWNRSRPTVRSVCDGKRVPEKTEQRWPDCRRCLDILCARAQRAAKAAEDPAQAELGLEVNNA